LATRHKHNIAGTMTANMAEEKSSHRTSEA